MIGDFLDTLMEEHVVPKCMQDETSQMLCRSQSQREFERFAYDSSFAQTDPTAHYAPSDRIGRNFTPTAKSLTMKKAQGISKAIMFGGGKPVLSRKPRGAAATPVVTAPAAYNTMAFGADDVLKHAPGPSEDAAWPKLLPSLDSPNTKRMRLRQERSVDDSRYLAPTPKLMSLTGGEGRPHADFDHWDPLAASAPAALHLQLELSGAMPPAPETMSPSDDARQSLASIERFWGLVESAVQSGALHAAGAGQKRALAELPVQWFEAIAQRVAMGSTAYALMVSDAFRQQLAIDSHAEVSGDFVYSVARSMVDYELHFRSGGDAWGAHSWSNAQIQVSG